MVYWREALPFTLCVLNLVFLNLAQEDYQYIECVEKSGFYSPDSTYRRNVDIVLSSLAPNTDQHGYYRSSVGENSDLVSTMALCRGDVSDIKTCRDCIANAANKLKEECFTFKEALGGTNKCLVLYTSKILNGAVDSPTSYMNDPNQNVPNIERINQTLPILLDRLRGMAASGGSLRKFAAGSIMVTDSMNIYGCVQCIPVLSEKQCNDCLEGAFQEIKICCNKRAGGRVVKPSCNLRYEITPFIAADYSTIHINTTPDPPSSPGRGNNKTKLVVIAVVSPVASAIVLIIGISIISGRRKHSNPMRRSEMDDISSVDEIITEESLQYDFGTISKATDNFSDANKLGQGGFGAVYKGKLPNGQEVAIKRLAKSSEQGELEFRNEVLLLAKLHHRNLVRLLGFSLEGTERLLIYELVNNSSLDNILFDPIKRAHFGWDKRYKIIVGVARGILYLHEDSRLRIIHRDLKASNILLDNDLNPKISDFGTARLFDLNETHGTTRKIVGTYGYMSPEYAMHGRFSVKSDVFSFGVLVLETVSGEKINSIHNAEDAEYPLSYAWKSWQEGAALNLIDPILKAGDSRSIPNIMKCIHVGILCVQESVSVRPTVASVLAMLNDSSITLPVPLKPGFYISSGPNAKLPSINPNKTYSGGNDPITVLVPR